jgi:hypothetical protein
VKEKMEMVLALLCEYQKSEKWKDVGHILDRAASELNEADAIVREARSWRSDRSNN